MTVGSDGAFAKLPQRVHSVGLLREAPGIYALGSRHTRMTCLDYPTSAHVS